MTTKKSSSQPLWTPQAKLSERERQMAWHLFVEAWKIGLADGEAPSNLAFTADKLYAECIKTVRVCSKMEDQDVAP